MVTHEPDIAAFATRQIHMKDGRVLQDTQVERPLDASTELLALQGDVGVASHTR